MEYYKRALKKTLHTSSRANFKEAAEQLRKQINDVTRNPNRRASLIFYFRLFLPCCLAVIALQLHQHKAPTQNFKMLARKKLLCNGVILLHNLAEENTTWAKPFLDYPQHKKWTTFFLSLTVFYAFGSQSKMLFLSIVTLAQQQLVTFFQQNIWPS